MDKSDKPYNQRVSSAKNPLEMYGKVLELYGQILDFFGQSMEKPGQNMDKISGQISGIPP